MQPPTLPRMADILAQAARTGEAVEQFGGSLTLPRAYEVQRLLLDRRRAEGASYIGPKLGFTSRAKMAQMGVDEIIMGWLVDDMQIENGGQLSLDALVHPRIEPEIAFRLGRAVDVEGPSEDIVRAVDAVAPALEVIDSRYLDFTFSLADVVADNTSACRFVIGDWSDVTSGDALDDLAVTLSIDGNTVETGSTSAILGNPWAALLEIVPLARRYGFELPSGSVILAGAATAAVPLMASTAITATVDTLGTVSLEVTVGTG